MEIKVLCPCGAKYRFPVESVNYCLPSYVVCPVCGLDNTNVARAFAEAYSQATKQNLSITAATDEYDEETSFAF